MIISNKHTFISQYAKTLIQFCPVADKAYNEIRYSILNNNTSGKDKFILNNSAKHCNGVALIKEGIYRILEEQYMWFREKPLNYFQNEAQKGGPIDVYKEFGDQIVKFKVGLEFETGNVASVHRSMNKLCLGLLMHELDMAVLILPIKNMSFYLTDRVANYEELQPYLPLLESYSFIVLGFDADQYSSNVPILPKGNDGMSKRKVRKWL